MEKRAEAKEELNVGKSRPIQSFIDDYPDSENMKLKVPDLRENYEGLRVIRGDGNCFYRAVMYEYVELLILHGEDCINDFKNEYDFLFVLFLNFHEQK